MRRVFCSILLLVATALAALADEVKFSVELPSVVAVGQPFRVEFTVNASAKGFVAPNFEGFDVMAGPSESTSHHMQLINGKASQSVITSFGFVLVCSSEGEYTIGAATVKVDGKEYQSRPRTVKAIKEQTSAQRPSQGGAAAQPQQPQVQLAEDDILLIAEVDRTNVYKGEPIRVTYKLCTRVGIGGVEGQKVPSFAGFWMQRLGVDSGRWDKEEIGGKIYDTHLMAEYILFPQQSGMLDIEPMELDVVARLQVRSQQRNRDPFDMFFSGPQMREVRRKIASKALTVNVKPLPAGAPQSFSGAVGELEMEVTPPPTDMVANSAATYTVRLSGRGNLSMIQAPHLELPTSFEQYNTKSTESIEASRGGLRGYRQFEYPMIARADGDFIIPALEYSYFNPKLGKYVTLSSAEYLIHVSPDQTAASSSGPNAALVSGMNKEDIKFLGRDIRFIKLGGHGLKPEGRVFMFSGLWWLLLVVLVGVAIGVGSWLGSYLKQMRNESTLKGRRANKVALMRLRAAEKYMQEANTKGFYEEMLRALWGYMGDKLNIPVADLTKESIRESLSKRSVASEAIEQFTATLTDCEYAQYAPSGSGHMKDAYLGGVEVISRMEEELNR